LFEGIYVDSYEMIQNVQLEYLWGALMTHMGIALYQAHLAWTDHKFLNEYFSLGYNCRTVWSTSILEGVLQMEGAAVQTAVSIPGERQKTDT
jgi:hypothetical protein